MRDRPRSLTTAGVEVRSSSRTSTSTRNPDQHPVTHTHLGRANNLTFSPYLRVTSLDHATVSQHGTVTFTFRDGSQQDIIKD